MHRSAQSSSGNDSRYDRCTLGFAVRVELQFSAWRKLILPRPGNARRSEPFRSKRVRPVYLIRLSGND